MRIYQPLDAGVDKIQTDIDVMIGLTNTITGNTPAKTNASLKYELDLISNSFTELLNECDRHFSLNNFYKQKKTDITDIGEIVLNKNKGDIVKIVKTFLKQFETLYEIICKIRSYSKDATNNNAAKIYKVVVNGKDIDMKIEKAGFGIGTPYIHTNQLDKMFDAIESEIELCKP